MADEQSQHEPNEAYEPDTNNAWPVEDASDAVENADRAIVEDDEETPFSSVVSIDSEVSADVAESTSSDAVAHVDDTSDAAEIDIADEASESELADSGIIDPTRAVARHTHRVAVELKKVELEVRRLLETVDNKRKRKLGGTRRWNELEDDMASWRYSDRHSEQTLSQLRDLIYRRHYLFKELTNLASTRPVLNS